MDQLRNVDIDFAFLLILMFDIYSSLVLLKADLNWCNSFALS